MGLHTPDLHLAEGQTEEGVCATERSYPNVGVDHILNQYLEYFSTGLPLSGRTAYITP